jgi:hypothetical protein
LVGEGALVGYCGIYLYDDFAWVLYFQASESMDMSQSQEPISEDHDAHMVPSLQGVAELVDGLQGEVSGTLYLSRLCFVDFHVEQCFLPYISF